MNKSGDNPLHELIAIEKDARAFGFEWPDAYMIIEQAVSECDEIKSALLDEEPRSRVEEEIGDLLHTAVSMCLFSGFDPEDTLARIVKKFSARMQALKAVAACNGYNSLKGLPIELVLELWREAKMRASEKQGRPGIF
ncbi:MazG nucleotide pyrophosphohydrolase domain-containing protein [Legionella spiritensis]|uniref:Nucleotide pyrophosphohydrolase n=1 Tax=Legionella spiritensis TaxID=452 RepID=A0A0W0ZB54_LEGSP|nr:MazG nucleotide pyrophosphohydrolase domain-containing protein [Legionella spiritensis]KTD66352.1 nucleotide pyrophosphohydrolase [Legionella spiritensis]SNV48758.1 nucleotide pyrophosphohydrolase [Legionella spiritensis]